MSKAHDSFGRLSAAGSRPSLGAVTGTAPSVDTIISSSMPWQSIVVTEAALARPVLPSLVQKLAPAILASGLLHPVGVDLDGVLIFGGHRHAAVGIILSKHPNEAAKLFPGGVVRISRLPFRWSAHPATAREYQSQENKLRRQLTKQEEVACIRDLYARPNVAHAPGPKPDGVESLTSLVAVTFGVSPVSARRKIEFALGHEKEVTHTPLEVAMSKVRAAARALEAARAACTVPEAVDGDCLSDLERAIAACIQCSERLDAQAIAAVEPPAESPEERAKDSRTEAPSEEACPE
jgi:hypothetical protein